MGQCIDLSQWVTGLWLSFKEFLANWTSYLYGVILHINIHYDLTPLVCQCAVAFRWCKMKELLVVAMELPFALTKRWLSPKPSSIWKMKHKYYLILCIYIKCSDISTFSFLQLYECRNNNIFHHILLPQMS